jgi:hypothetical protein
MKTTRRIFCFSRCLFLLAFLILNARLFADDTNQWKVQVTSLQIIAPQPKGTNDLREKLIHKIQAESDRLPGMAVKLRITAPEGQIANLPDSTIESFTDDKGSNLLAQASQENYVGESESGTYHVSFNNGEPSLLIEIRAPNLPSKSATELNIIGKVMVPTADESKQFTAENVKLKPGAEFDFGDLKLTVSDAKLDGKLFVVGFQSAQDLSSLSTLEFFNDRGGKIKTSLSGLSTFTHEGKTTADEWDCIFPKPQNSVKIIATRWMGFKTTEVPINIKIGLGL